MAGGSIGLAEHRAALVAGLGLLAMTIPAILADMAAFRAMLVLGDAAATVGNILTSMSTFRAGILGMLLVLILDVVVAWALYLFLRSATPGLSLLAAWLRVVYAAVLGIALSCLAGIAVMLSRAEYLTAINIAELHDYVLVLFNSYYEVWGLGFVIFGCHLLVLGLATLRSGYVPKVLGILLLIAGAGYVAEYSAKVLWPRFGVPFSVAGWGELVFMFWLLWVGRPWGWRRKAV